MAWADMVGSLIVRNLATLPEVVIDQVDEDDSIWSLKGVFPVL